FYGYSFGYGCSTATQYPSANRFPLPLHDALPILAAIPEQRQPFSIAHHDIEFVAMHDDVAFAIRRFVDELPLDLNAAEALSAILSQAIVVVAGNEYNPGALACLA